MNNNGEGFLPRRFFLFLDFDESKSGQKSDSRCRTSDQPISNPIYKPSPFYFRNTISLLCISDIRLVCAVAQTNRMGGRLEKMNNEMHHLTNVGTIQERP